MAASWHLMVCFAKNKEEGETSATLPVLKALKQMEKPRSEDVEDERTKHSPAP